MFVTVNGAKLYFDVEGAGLVPDGPDMREKPTVVLVHGGPGADHSIYKPFFSSLSDVAQVVYYDHRGNGRSDPCDRATWTLDQWGDDLAELCDVLGITNPIVLGTSFGGFVALSYATRHPGHPAKLGLISTAAQVDFEVIYQAFERLGGAGIRDIAQAYWENPTPEGRDLYREKCLPFYQYNAGTETEWQSRIIWNNEPAMWFNGPRNEHGRMDFRAELARIECPTLVMVGDEDPITPIEFSRVLVEHLRDDLTTFKTYAQCGHGVVGDKPSEALRDIRDFILA